MAWAVALISFFMRRSKKDLRAYYCRNDDALEDEFKSEALELKQKELSQIIAADDIDEEGPVYVCDVPEDIEVIKALRREERKRELIGSKALEEFKLAKKRRQKAAEFIQKRANAMGTDCAVDVPNISPDQIEPSNIVYRDEDGFRITKDRWLELEANKKGGYKAKRSKREERTVPEWAQGVTQIKEAEDLEKQFIGTTVPQFEITEETDKALKEELRPEDPMYETLVKAKAEEHDQKVRENVGVEDAPVRPLCKFPSQPNRFNIAAGYRWDGVIRGNGYEARYLAALND